ncbi:hypothetical protein NLI96_g3280 [Meripilus lineatus]|uniref:Cytochrome P450 n=1 Tax=Meripilus lineatus TaxID=2056292 RepID=A0AAD5V729_9APHY|nr:hypothetical protein NLI96_g3280 [Physisporinus lineatus]
MTTPIPSPPSIPFLGHVTQIEKEVPMRSFMLLAQQYGEIYELNMIGRKVVFLNSYNLLQEVCDEKRFRKSVNAPLIEVRNGLGDGLFTAFPDEPNWATAHRLLIPAFGAPAIRDMFDDMLDVVSQLVLKWERFGPKHKIDPADDFTRMTLDAIALCSMSYRFNSFYRDAAHPFVQSMVDFLIECGLRANRPSVVNSVMRGTKAQYESDIQVMASIADEIIADRKQNPIEKKDLLNTMLYSKDPKTGESLSDENIRNNPVPIKLSVFKTCTELGYSVSGHETTSGLLTFSLFHLIKNPEAMRKLREEVDEVLGDQTIQLTDIGKLRYTLAVLRESLRLNVPAAVRTMTSTEDQVIGNGKYFIEKGTTVAANAWTIQRDTHVWGDDAEEFKPERMLNGKFDAVPANAWQPFGFGARACIGRAFAIQEAQIALASIIQRFDFVFENPSYTLELKQTLTLKPTNFYVHAIPRAGKSVPLYNAPSAKPATPKDLPSGIVQSLSGLVPMQVLYGSNTGTSESFAQRIASVAASHGFRATLATLDSSVERLITDGPIVVVTASFEGQPADNAAHFVNWLENLKSNELANVRFAVFGCGNRDWSRTYQRIPKLCDDILEKRGGRRLVPRGEGDASQPEFFEKFDTWEQTLWKTLEKEYDVTASKGSLSEPAIRVNVLDEGTTRAETLRQTDTSMAKRHIEFTLPENVSYRAGDYLAVLPLNPSRIVQRAMSHFRLSSEQNISLSAAGPTFLPVDRPINVSALLSGYVELSQPATTRDLHLLLEVDSSAETKNKLQELSSSYATNVLAKRLSLLDILEDLPDIDLPFASFLSLLPSMRVRQYSISSSPLWDPRKVTLTVSILDAPSISGRSESFQGVASTFLAGLRPGNKVQVAIRPSAASFHPPRDPKTPLIMFCSGTGLAPMRGFIQERALQKEAGQEVGKITLFFGCRRPNEDYLYSTTDMKKWVEEGVVDVRPAFSRETDKSLGCKYVQDRIWHDRSDIRHAYDEAGAKFFTCGSRKVAEGVKQVLMSIICEARGVSEEEGALLFDRAILERYSTDVFE